MSPGFDLDAYEPVAARLERWWDKHGGTGSVLTELVKAEAGEFIVKASLLDCDIVIATGFAREREDQGHVNRTSALENAETSAIGRALANAGYSSRSHERPSREEMGKVVGGDRKREVVQQLTALGLPTNGPLDVLEQRLKDSASQPVPTRQDADSDGAAPPLPEAVAPSQPLPPLTAEETDLATGPCQLCMSTHAKRVRVGGKTVCRDTKGCNERQEMNAVDESPFV